MSEAQLPATGPATAIVIGAGVVGLTSAIALQARGLAVTLVGDEPHWQRATSWGNAGHIATEQVVPLASWDNVRSLPRRLFSRGGPVGLPPRAATAWVPFGLRLLRAAARVDHGTAALRSLLADAMPAWQRLLSAAGAAHLLGTDGHFVVWETPDSAERGRAAWAAADIGAASLRDVTEAERAQLARLVARPIAGAIRFDGTGRITDQAALEAALRRHYAGLGGTFRQASVTALAIDRSARVGLAGGDTLAADLAVVCAGVRSAALLAPLGFTVPMIAERGYHVEWDQPDWPADQPPVVFEDRAVIATRFAHGLRLAGFTEFAHPDTPPDPRKWERLDAHAAALGLHPEGTRRWMGARPTLPDYLPVIGRDAARPALAFAFGHQHLGLTLAAVSAERLAGQLMGEPADLSAFAIDRFA